MSNDKSTIIAVAALVVAIICCAVCVFALTSNGGGSTGLYIGEHEVTEEGNLFDNKYGNLEYDRESNTLYISRSVLSMDHSGYRVYDDVITDIGVRDQVGFIASYEGTRALNLVFLGDNHLLGSSDTMDYVGGFYFAKDVVVNISGPGMLIDHNVNHSLFYGMDAKIIFHGLNMEVDGIIDVPLAADTIAIEDSKMNFRTSEGYTGLFTTGETVVKDSSITAAGFDYGMYIGTTCIYDSQIEVDAEDIGLRIFRCTSYDSSIISTSAGAGMFFFDPLDFYGGYLYSDAQELYGVYSGDTTVEFRDAKVEVHTANGNAIQAWHVNIYDSDVTAKSENGSGIYANFNAIVADSDCPRITIGNSYVDAAGTVGAVWDVGEIKLVNSVLKSGCKILSVEYPGDIIFSAICDSSETELKMVLDEEYAYPTNASKKVQIEITI